MEKEKTTRTVLTLCAFGIVVSWILMIIGVEWAWIIGISSALVSLPFFWQLMKRT